VTPSEYEAPDRPDGSSPNGDQPVTTNPVARVLLAVDRVVGLAEQALLVFTMTVLIGMGAYAAVARNVFDYSPAWGDEILRNSVFFTAMAGAALAAHTNQLISLDVFTRIMSPRARLFTKTVTKIFTIAICVYMAVTAMEMRSGMLSEHEYHVLHPANGALVLTIGMGLIAFHVTIRVITNIIHLIEGTSPEEQIPSGH